MAVAGAWPQDRRDAPGGRPRRRRARGAPRWVALPETAEEVAAVLRACAEHDLAVVPAGGGTKLHWGAPPERCDVLVDLCCMNEVAGARGGRPGRPRAGRA